MDNRAAVLESLQAINENYTSTVFDHPFAVCFPVPESCPYAFPAKTLGEVADFLLKSRERMYATRYRSGSRLAWNVKVYHADALSAVDYSTCNKALDSAWTKFLDSKQGQHIHDIVFSAAQAYYHGDWTAYPGEDQGDWKFFFGGRSGGWLCLESWRGTDFATMSEDSYIEFVASLIDDYMLDRVEGLARFYAGIVTADQDFTPEKASSEISYQYGVQRELWEEERREIGSNLRHELEASAKRILDAYGYDSAAPGISAVIFRAVDEIEECVV